MGTGPVAFDTMIVTALVGANRTQLLRESMASRARVTERIAGELRGRSRSLPALANVVPPPPGTVPFRHSFGATVEMTRDEAQLASDLQRAWYGQAVIDENPKKDRGEAELIAVCLKRGWPLVSQDHNAVFSGAKRRVPVFGLPELLMLFATEGRCLPDSAWRIYAGIAGTTVELVAQGWDLTSANETLFFDCCTAMREEPAAA
jgi:hypothetical protein